MLITCQFPTWQSLPAAVLNVATTVACSTVACSAHTYLQYGTQFPLRKRNSHYGNQNSIMKRNLHYVYAISNTETQFALRKRILHYGTLFPLCKRNSHYGNENCIMKRNLHYDGGSEAVYCGDLLHIHCGCLAIDQSFLANVNSRSRSLYAIARPSVVCLSVCNVRAPYSGGSDFRQYFYSIMYLGHPWTSTENFTEIVPGEPLRRGS